VIADMNAPTEDNWVVKMTGEVPPPEDTTPEEMVEYQWPAGWDYFVQPPALIEEFGPDGKTVTGYRVNPLAENLTWLPRIDDKIAYIEMIKGKKKRWIDSRLMNRITAPVEGEAVWPMFVDETHVAKQNLAYNPSFAVYVGLDFGRRPAAVFAQLIGDRWVVFGELVGHDEGSTTFAPRVRRWLFWHCKGLVDYEDTASLEFAVKAGRLRLFGDPKGADGVQSSEITAYDVFRDHGMRVDPAPVPTNDIGTRIEAVEYVLNGLRDGMPRFLLSPACRTLKMAMAGGYHFKKGDMLKVAPVKDRYSDIADALQYMILGAGEGRVMTGRGRPHDRAHQGPSVAAFRGRYSIRRRVG
jgi:hypothetical protein